MGSAIFFQPKSAATTRLSQAWSALCTTARALQGTRPALLNKRRAGASKDYWGRALWRKQAVGQLLGLWATGRYIWHATLVRSHGTSGM